MMLITIQAMILQINRSLDQKSFNELSFLSDRVEKWQAEVFDDADHDPGSDFAK